MPIQINGKTKSIISVGVGEEKDQVVKKALKDMKIAKNLKNKEITKTIFVKDKIVNLVIK